MSIHLAPPGPQVPVDQGAQEDLFDDSEGLSTSSKGPLDEGGLSSVTEDEVLAAIKVRHSPIALAAKRIFDLSFVIIFLGLFWWVYPLVMLAIKLSGPGPVVYGHTRVGLAGRKFRCYKFRSMVVNSKEVLEHLLETDPQARAEWECSFKLKDDPRITRIGALLRRTSLDELPQLWNIVRGALSVVGPRPVTRRELQLYYGTSLRHYISLRPGLTGPWQVGGRSDTTYEERVEMDRDYAERWTLWGDFKTVMATVAVIFSKRGAY